MANNRNEHLRYRYGICLNDSCSKCKSKEVQQIPSRKEFECEECHKPLRECPPPKTFWQKYGKIIIGVAVVVIAAIVILIFAGNTNNEPTSNPGGTNPVPKDTITTDSITIDPTTKDSITTNSIITPPKPQPKLIFGGAATLSADGKVITFNRGYNLDLKGFEDETIYLHAGDEIKNFEIKDGRLIRGELFMKNGEAQLLTGLNERL